MKLLLLASFAAKSKLNDHSLFLQPLMRIHPNDASNLQPLNGTSPHPQYPSRQPHLRPPQQNLMPQPTLHPQQRFRRHSHNPQVLPRPPLRHLRHPSHELRHAAKLPTLNLREDVFAHSPIAERIANIIRDAGGAGVELQVESQDQGLRLAGARPGVWTDAAGRVQVAEGYGVEGFGRGHG